MKKLLISFSILDGMYWACYAAFTAFITTYMLKCGMKSAELSIMLAGFMLTSFLGAFFWGGRCDKRKTNRKIFLAEFSLAILAASMIFLLSSRNLLIAALLYPLFGFLVSPLGSNLDAWMLRSFHQDADLYGIARAIGSSGYAIMCLGMGQLIRMTGYDAILYAMLASAAVVLIMAVFMKEEPYPETSTQLKPESPVKLFHKGPYMFMLTVIFLTGIAISPVNNLKTVILQSVGGDVGMLGLDSFLGVMAQALFIFISGRLRRYRTDVRLFVVSFSVLIVMVLVLTADNPWLIILSTVINNISYGVMLPTMREITENTVSGSLKNTAHSLCDAMFGSFAGVIALSCSGVMMDAFGVKSVALAGLVIMLVPVAMTGMKMMHAR